MPWYLTLPLLQAESDLDSDNDLFMDDEDGEEEDLTDDLDEDLDVDVDTEFSTDLEIATSGDETEASTAPETLSVAEPGNDSDTTLASDIPSENLSQASTAIIDTDDERILTSTDVENQSNVTAENGPEQHREENDEVEIIRVERRTGQPTVPVTAEADESTDDFQTPRKRRRIRVTNEEEEKEKTSKEPAVNLDDTFDFESCPICFESWTNSGDHRLASLKCGHLFGFGCIDKWLKGPGKGCPQCNAAAKRKDIRVIYAKKLSMADTAEADRLRTDLSNERHLRLKAEAEATSYRIQAQFIGDECTRLKTLLQQLEERIANSQGDISMKDLSTLGVSMSSMSGGATSSKGGYLLHKLVRLNEGGCRVMSACNYMNLLCIAQASPNPLFRGFGIRKIHLAEYHMDRFLVLHSQMIRDLSLHPDMTDGLLLSVSLDKTAKLVSLFTGQVVQTYTCPQPVWSCTWNRDNHHQFFTGLVNGQVMQFDTRKTNAPLNTVTGTSVTPVCGLQYVPRDINHSTFRHGGLFVGQLDRISFLEEIHEASLGNSNQSSVIPTNFRWHPLPLEGSVLSLNFEDRTRHMMASFRPSRTHASLSTVRHLVCQMESRGGAESTSISPRVCTCNLVHSLTGGRTSSRIVRSRLYNGPKNRLLAASGDEETGGTFIWDAAQGERLQLLKGPNAGPVIDIAPFDMSGENRNIHGIATLTETAVQFFRWQEST